jgi:hypothetical protein
MIAAGTIVAGPDAPGDAGAQRGVDIDKQEPAQVATQYLRESGYIQ